MTDINCRNSNNKQLLTAQLRKSNHQEFKPIYLQGDQSNNTVLFWYLAKHDLPKARYRTIVHYRHFLQGTRKKGHVYLTATHIRCQFKIVAEKK